MTHIRFMVLSAQRLKLAKLLFKIPKLNFKTLKLVFKTPKLLNPAFSLQGTCTYKHREKHLDPPADR